MSFVLFCVPLLQRQDVWMKTMLERKKERKKEKKTLVPAVYTLMI
jgi:hypothetical protein